MKPPIVWTTAMLARARELEATGLRPNKIDTELGLRKGTTSHKFSREREKAVNRERRARGEIIRAAHGGKHSEKGPPAAVLHDRNERDLAPRTVTQVMMGDPAPGWSALERKG